MRRANRALWLAVAVVLVTAACTGTADDTTTTAAAPTTTQPHPTTTGAPTTTTTATATAGELGHDTDVDPDLVAAALATAGFQDVSVAEAAGWGSTMDALGCFHSGELGGMGLHYLNGELLDDQVDVTQPEALVYELDADGEIAGLIAHEYIVPVEAWTSEEPPSLFGMDFHQHPVLPLWVLHVWLWKDNPSGMFVDYNPKVRMCPEGVPVFGVELP